MKSFSYKLRILLVLWNALYVTNVQTNLIQSRIISGTPAALGQFPWQAIIKEDEHDNIKCGGSIISDSWVLTAAHCTYDLISAYLVFGTIYLQNTVNNMTSDQLFIHPQYVYPNPNNDISLIKLPTPLVFTSIIQPIALASLSQASNSFVGLIATISGFGLTDDEYLDPSDILLWARVKIVETNYCRSIYPTEDIDDTNMCAVSDGNTNMSPCSGDSGGALMLIINNTPVQIGINSFVAREICTEAYPSGYVSVTSFLPYISNITGLPLS